MTNTVGSYAVTSIDFNKWFKDEHNIKQPNKNKKQKNKKKIVYPIFLDYANLTDDIFWTKKFNVWAGGKLPKYFTFNNHCIYYNDIECQLTENAVESSKLCIHFFKTYGGIFSKQDELNDMDYQSETMDTETLTESLSISNNDIDKVWSKCDKKTQELMLKNYVNSLTQVMSLSIKEYNVLLQTIRLTIYCKNFNKNNIVIEKDKIIEIKGLMWDDKMRTFKMDIIPVKSKKINDGYYEQHDEYPKDMITNLVQKIDKYHDMYDKKYCKYR
ncbi:MAG TPA: hypothetical protein VLG50_05940 [Candidatus Saccharimonadales bacterium]|nr:hypothetical protein [Candidatus Saccharimonadales bacterium]